MSPVESGGRHYRGPEQPQAPPPMPSGGQGLTMPSAAELMQDEPLHGAVVHEDFRSPVMIAFESWLEETKSRSGKPEELDKIGGLLEEAFLAGWQSATKAAPQDLPLEGTVESRTIIAALELFKAQVLDHQPEEVKTGEWLNARDVEVLIQGIRANAAKGR